jgi:uncharacterized membrane protein
MSPLNPLTPEERELVTTGARRVGLKIFICTFVGALIIAIVGISTNSPAIVVGVLAGTAAAVFGLVVSFKARAAVRRDLGKPNRHGSSLD